MAAEIRRYLAEARDGLKLEAALELTPAPGKRAWWTDEAEATRNRLLRELAHHFPGLSLREKSTQIAKLGRDYQTRGFRLDQRRPEAASGDPRRRLLRAALETGAPFPGSGRHVQTILGGK